MTELKNEQTDSAEVLFDFGKNISLTNQPTGYIRSPLITILDKKLLRRHKFTKPVTYRRPSYLQYIDYA